MKNRFPQRGAALVVVLSIIILAVVLVVGLTLAMRMERSAAFYNLERARAEGRGRPGGPARELALYLAHGLDHLAGADDDVPARRRAMRRRETAWLDADPAAWRGLAAR